MSANYRHLLLAPASSSAAKSNRLRRAQQQVDVQQAMADCHLSGLPAAPAERQAGQSDALGPTCPRLANNWRRRAQQQQASPDRSARQRGWQACQPAADPAQVYQARSRQATGLASPAECERLAGGVRQQQQDVARRQFEAAGREPDGLPAAGEPAPAGWRAQSNGRLDQGQYASQLRRTSQLQHQDAERRAAAPRSPVSLGSAGAMQPHENQTYQTYQQAQPEQQDQQERRRQALRDQAGGHAAPSGSGQGAAGQQRAGGQAAGARDERPLHVNFNRSSQSGGADGDEGDSRKKKYLTAKYGQQQMNLIKKRLKIEMWLYEQLQELAKGTKSEVSVSGAGGQAAPCGAHWRASEPLEHRQLTVAPQSRWAHKQPPRPSWRSSTSTWTNCSTWRTTRRDVAG